MTEVSTNLRNIFFLKIPPLLKIEVGFFSDKKSFSLKGVTTLHRINKKLVPAVNEMMATHTNAMVIANILQKNHPLVVPTPNVRLIIFDTETTRLW